MRKWVWMAALVPCIGLAQLRVATWNITNYGGGRVADLQTAVFGSFQGRSMNPDVLLAQEILSSAAQTALLNALNSAPGSSGTWAAAPFTDGNDTDNAFFFRTDRIQLIGSTIVGTGGAAPLPPRDTKRYDVRLLGYSILQPKLALYCAHMKAGSAAEDQARKLAEAALIRNNAASLVGFDGFAAVGDFNLYTSTEDAYVKLTGSEANNAGRLFDPILTSGSWDGSNAFRYVHTQDPFSSMNSRFDFVLLCRALIDGQGFDYAGNPNLAYSTVTWNDPAHSYRAWGNDGSSFGQSLALGSNQMVGSAIAQAIRNVATSVGGHIPVFLDLNVPAETAAAPNSIDFGVVVQGQTPTRAVQVWNATSEQVWRTGVAPLGYQLATVSPFGVPSGTFTDVVGGGSNAHFVSVDSSATGEFAGTIAINPTAAGSNAVSIPVSAKVVPDELYSSAWTIVSGSALSGGLAQLQASDDAYAKLNVVFFSRSAVAGGRVEFEAVAPVTGLNSIAVQAESGADFLIRQVVEAYDFASAAWVQVHDRTLTRGDHGLSILLTEPNRFVQPSTKKLKIRFSAYPGLAMPDGGQFTWRFDKVAWILR